MFNPFPKRAFVTFVKFTLTDKVQMVLGCSQLLSGQNYNEKNIDEDNFLIQNRVYMINNCKINQQLTEYLSTVFKITNRQAQPQFSLKLASARYNVLKIINKIPLHMLLIISFKLFMCGYFLIII